MRATGTRAANRSAYSALAAGVLLAVYCAGVYAQPYPARTIRFIVPYVPGGGVDFVSRTIALPFVKSGKLRALGVTTAKRTRAAPDLPTIAEAGLPGYEQSAWHGLLAPAGTPEAIIVKLHAEVARVLRLPEVVERFSAQGIDVIGSTTAEFAAFIKQDVAKYAKLVKTAGIRID